MNLLISNQAKKCFIALILTLNLGLFVVPVWAAPGDVKLANQVVFTAITGGDGMTVPAFEGGPCQ